MIDGTDRKQNISPLSKPDKYDRVPHLSSQPGPRYMPGEFNIPENYNVLQISELHAFEEFSKAQSEEYAREVAQQVNEYTETYEVDEIHVMGDTGTFNDVYSFLDELNKGPEVLIVAGDEDKKDRKNGDEFTGFFTEIESQQPFDVDVEYSIFDEGFEKDVEGNRYQASHHPMKADREEKLNEPDPRPDGFLDSLFSVEKDTNEQTAECMIYDPDNTSNIPNTTKPDEGKEEWRETQYIESPPSLRGTDVVVYDHLHMPYPRTVGNTAVIGLGGRRNNHDPGSEEIPSQSIHLTSFEDDKIHTLHFNAGEDRIFEHQIFRQTETDVEIYDVQIPEEINLQAGYRPIQQRIRPEKIRDESFESEEDLPPTWQEEI